MAVTKCKITTLALEELNVLLWGFKCKNRLGAVLENYIEYLNCPDVNLKICKSNDIESCIGNEPVDLTCNLTVAKIGFEIVDHDEEDVEEDIRFSVAEEDIHGEVSPFTYSWGYEDLLFTVVGTQNDTVLKLKLIGDKDLNSLVASVNVQIWDANGCTGSKICWYRPLQNTLFCRTGYLPCLTPKNLQVAYTYVTCAKPKSLIVTMTH